MNDTLWFVSAFGLIIAAVAGLVWWIWREDPMWMAMRPRARRRGGPATGERQRVLFVCTHNAARSQMAEALLRDLGGARFHVASAGTEPTRLHPLAQRVMMERGLSLTAHTAKALEDVGTRWNYVITVCDAASERCPEFPAKTSRLHWSIDDPSTVTGSPAEQLDAFRRARDELAERITRWLAEQRQSS